MTLQASPGSRVYYVVTAAPLHVPRRCVRTRQLPSRVRGVCITCHAARHTQHVNFRRRRSIKDQRSIRMGPVPMGACTTQRKPDEQPTIFYPVCLVPVLLVRASVKPLDRSKRVASVEIGVVGEVREVDAALERIRHLVHSAAALEQQTGPYQQKQRSEQRPSGRFLFNTPQRPQTSPGEDTSKNEKHWQHYEIGTTDQQQVQLRRSRVREGSSHCRTAHRRAPA